MYVRVCAQVKQRRGAQVTLSNADSFSYRLSVSLEGSSEIWSGPGTQGLSLPILENVQNSASQSPGEVLDLSTLYRIL